MKFPVRFSSPASLFVVALLVCGDGATAFAADRVVSSIPELQAAIDEAVAGDVITVKNGAYTTEKAITVKCSGTAGNPITIAAESVGGVEITGTNGFNIATPAAHVVISGFQLKHAAGKNTIGADTGHARFTRNTFHCTGDGAYLSVVGDDAEIDHNEFRDKRTVGSMLAVGGTGSQIARRVWIHHNYFHDFTNAGANASEMIRVGLSALSGSTGAGLIEHNLLVRCRGENDLISNRSSGNIYRYNTLVDSPSSQFSLRHGNDCTLYGNVFRNTEGLRIFGDRHLVFSNYLEGNYIGVNIGNGDSEIAEGAPLSSHDRPDDCLIAFNTFVENRTHYQLSRRGADARGATNITFANNILQGGVGAKIEGPYIGAVWSANLLWNTTSGDMPQEGFTTVDPLLVAGSDGLKRPQAGSPANESAVGVYPKVTFDLGGKPRPEKKSKGADEPLAEPGAARLLSAADVGPGAVAAGPVPTTPITAASSVSPTPLTPVPPAP